jgi:hypothetical protein
MRAKEFITESGITGSILPDVQRTLPAAWVIDDLKNNDFYMQYRFGVALAGAKGKEQRQKDHVPPYDRESTWGENEVIVSYAGADALQSYLNDALAELNIPASAAKLVTSKNSEEPTSTGKKSPMNAFRGFE